MHMTTRLKVAALLGILAFIAAFLFQSITKVHLNDDDRVDRLTAAQRVEVFRVDGRNLKRSADEFIGEYPVISASSLTQHQSKVDLIRVLQPYFKNEVNRPLPSCITSPGLALRIRSGFKTC
jgi:hypothetical protein